MASPFGYSASERGSASSRSGQGEGFDSIFGLGDTDIEQPEWQPSPPQPEPQWQPSPPQKREPEASWGDIIGTDDERDDDDDDDEWEGDSPWVKRLLFSFFALVLLLVGGYVGLAFLQHDGDMMWAVKPEPTPTVEETSPPSQTPSAKETPVPTPTVETSTPTPSPSEPGVTREDVRAGTASLLTAQGFGKDELKDMGVDAEQADAFYECYGDYVFDHGSSELQRVIAGKDAQAEVSSQDNDVLGKASTECEGKLGR